MIFAVRLGQWEACEACQVWKEAALSMSFHVSD